MEKKLISLLTLFLFNCSLAFGQDPQDIIKEYEKIHRSIFPVNIKNHTKMRFFNSKDGKIIYGYRDSSYIDDSDRLEMIMSTWFDVASDDTIEQLKEYNNPFQRKTFVWDRELFYDYGEDTDQSGKIVFTRVYVTDEKEQAIKDAAKARMIAFEDGPLLGYMKSDTCHFIDILKSSDDLRLIDSGNEIDDIKCEVLLAKTESGVYKVWFAPGYDYNVLRLELTKSIGDKAYGYIVGQEARSLSSQILNELTKDNSLASIQKQECKFILSDVKLQEINGTWLPIEGKYYVKQTYQDGEYNESWYETKRVAIDLEPDLEALNAFKPKINNGVQVLYKGKPNIIDYVWRDGEIVPDIDDVLIDGLDIKIDNVESEIHSDNGAPKNEIEHVGLPEANIPNEVGDNIFEIANEHVMGMSKLILGLSGAICLFALVYLFAKARREK